MSESRAMEGKFGQPREIFSDADGPDSSENTKISSRILGGIAARG